MNRPMIPPCSLNEITTRTWAFERDVELCVAAGVPAIGLTLEKIDAVGIDAAARVLRAAGLAAACLQTAGRFSLGAPASLPAEIESARHRIAQAAVVRASCLVLFTGNDPRQSWEENLPAFRGVLDALLPFAAEQRVRLAIEPSHALRVETSFLHSFGDALDVADMVDSPWLGVVLEVNNAWIERGLYDNIAGRAQRIALVQVSDFRIGTRCTPERVVPGDGDIPLRRILHAVHAAGYRGYYDIELVGPEIEREGYGSAVARALAAYRALWQ